MIDQFSNYQAHIAQPFEDAGNMPDACGFITVHKPAPGQSAAEPIGFCLVRLIGNYYQIIEVVEMINLPLERNRIINYILNWAERVPFESLFIDLENYKWFNGDQRWNNALKMRTKPIRYPSIRIASRGEDIIQRQKDSLIEPINDGCIQTAKDLGLVIDRNTLLQVGQSGKIDAFAGCVEQIIKLQATILHAVANEQARIKAANGRSIY